MRTPKITRLFAAAAVAAALAAPALSQVKDYRQIKFPDMRTMTIPKPQRIVLDNGMVVMLLENHELPDRGDGACAPACGSTRREGRIVGHVRHGPPDGGTKTRTGDQLDDFLEARAAMIDTNVGVDSGGANSPA
jgi:zinc protease